MKNCLFLFILVVLTACHSQEDMVMHDEYAVGNSPTLELKPVLDTKTNRVVSYLPLPKEWEIFPKNGNAPTLKGPGGIVGYSYDEEMYLEQKMMGMVPPNFKLRRSVSMQQLIEGQFIPSLKKQGRKITNQYPLPKVAENCHQLLSQLLTNNTQIGNCETYAIESITKDGQMALFAVTKVPMVSYGQRSWMLLKSELFAPRENFEKAKNIYLYASSNAQLDQQFAGHYKRSLLQKEREQNQRNQAMLRSTGSAFQQRLRNDNAAFQKTQKMYAETSDAIGDMGMQTFRNNLNSSSYGQQSFNNMMYEENTMTDPWGGMDMQVQQGYDHYYANPDGEYIGTNDHFFDPNYSPGFDNSQWRPMDPN